MDVKRSGSQPSARGPAETFTGSVRIDPLNQAAPPARAIPATSFSVALGGGPVLRASRSPRTSGAPRDLSTRSGYAVRFSIGYQPPSAGASR